MGILKLKYDDHLNELNNSIITKKSEIFALILIYFATTSENIYEVGTNTNIMNYLDPQNI